MKITNAKETRQKSSPPTSQKSSKAARSLTPPSYGLSSVDNAPIQPVENKTGLPNTLRSGIESLSGIDMSDVNVHYNSSKPAQLQALAYAQGAQIHLAPGQEQHLPHEAWHVVQQKQGRVHPTVEVKGARINNEDGLEREASMMGAKASSLDANGIKTRENLIEAHGFTGSAIQRLVRFNEEHTISELTVPIPKKRIQFTKVKTGLTFPKRKPSTRKELVQTPLLTELQQIIQNLLGKTYQQAITFLFQAIERHLISNDFAAIEKTAQDHILEEVNALFTLMKQPPGEGTAAKELDVIIARYVEVLEKIYHPPGNERMDDMMDVTPKKLTSEDVLRMFLLHGDALDKRIGKWMSRLGVRNTKKSNALVKRQKRFNETGDHNLLMFTHTAPAQHSSENTHHQGKDVYPSAENQFNYFRTGENKQSQYFKGNKKKQFVFVQELYDFYKELDGSATFKSFETIAPGVAHALFNKGRYLHSGYGSEVNAYAKEKILKAAGKPYKGEQLLRGDTSAHHFINTSNEYAVSNYIDLLANPGKAFEASYGSTILQHCRDIVNRLSTLPLKHFNIVVANQKSGFITYPCPIIEPKSDKTLKSEEIQVYIKFIMEKFNADSKVKMYQRNSFGFLYPTISDLERSIRLWPGQLDPDYFVAKVSAILTLYDQTLSNPLLNVKLNSPAAKIPKGSNQHATLLSTLARTMAYVQSLYRKGGFAPGRTLDFLHQRIVSNLIKARIFLEMQMKDDFGTMDKEDFFLEATQVIENLNEFGLQLVELQQWNPTQSEFEKIINDSYGNAARPSGYHLIGAALTHSGMQAGMIAMKLRKQSQFDLGPAYFEFPGDDLNTKIAKQAELGRTGHYDPAYNYTHSKEVLEKAEVPFTDSDHQCIIIDITNVKPAEIGGILRRHYKNTASVFMYASLSKHFQFGMDRFTLGLIMELNKSSQAKSSLGSYAVPVELIRYFILMQGAHSLGLNKELPKD